MIIEDIPEVPLANEATSQEMPPHGREVNEENIAPRPRPMDIFIPIFERAVQPYFNLYRINVGNEAGAEQQVPVEERSRCREFRIHGFGGNGEPSNDDQRIHYYITARRTKRRKITRRNVEVAF